MPRGRKTSLTVTLTPEERQTLLAWQRSPSVLAAQAQRARAILLLVEGMTIKDIASVVGMHRSTVRKWIQRFQQEGLQGLVEQPSAAT